jgi:hypothetical protein
MQVKCIGNRGNLLPEGQKDAQIGITDASSWDIQAGTLYDVYGITLFRGYTYYYVLEEGRNDAPSMIPALLFEIVDHRIPADWSYNQFNQGPSADRFSFLMGPQIWIDDPMFLENLIDGDPDAEAVFRRQQVEMLAFRTA